MTTKEKSSWDTDSGLVDEADFWITEPYWGYRDEYQNGEISLLILVGESPDEDLESIIFPCGSGWEVVEQGKKVQHPKRVRFVKTSLVGRLIDRVVKELGVNMAERGIATDASVWRGLGFHFRREEISYGSGILEDRGGKVNHLMPVAVLEKPAEKKVEPTPAAEGKPDLTEKKLAALAKKLDREEFQKRAMDMTEVVENDDLMGAVLDDSPEGYWAKHH